MTLKRPFGEPAGLEWFFLILIIGVIMLLSSCCPRIVQQPPVIVDRWDTVQVMLPPPPPFVLPADSASLTFDLSQLCDSAWRARAKPERTNGKRIQAGLHFNGESVTFTCKEDSLIHLLDSVKGYIYEHDRVQTIETTYYKCPLDWPRWYHHALLGVIVLLIIAMVYIAFRRGV